MCLVARRNILSASRTCKVHLHRHKRTLNSEYHGNSRMSFCNFRLVDKPSSSALLSHICNEYTSLNTSQVMKKGRVSLLKRALKFYVQNNKRQTNRITKSKCQTFYKLLKRRKCSHFHRKHLKVNMPRHEVSKISRTKKQLFHDKQTDFVQYVNKLGSSENTVHSNNYLYDNNNNSNYKIDKNNFLHLDSCYQLKNDNSAKTPSPFTILSKFRNVSQRPSRSRASRAEHSSKLFLLACLYSVVVAQISVFASAANVAQEESKLDQSIGAIFNKVAYGSSTTKRSIPDSWSVPHMSTVATPILTTYRYREGNEEYLRVDEARPKPAETVDEGDEVEVDVYKERRHQHKGHHNPSSYELDLEKDHALPTSAPNADILKGNSNKHYSNPNRYANERSRHNLQTYGREIPESLDNDRLRDIGGIVRTYPETRRPSSLLETDSGKIASTQSSYNLLRNINPTPPMHRGDLPSYSPPSRSALFTPPLPPEFGNPFADKPTLKGTNSGSTNYQNRRPLPPPSIMPKHDRIPFRPDLPRSGQNLSSNKSSPAVPNKSNESERKVFTGNSEGKKKALNTPSLNVNLDKFGDFLQPHTPVNESQFEYEPMLVIPSISRILSGSNGRKDAIPDVLLRTVTAKPNFQAPTASRNPPTQPQDVNSDTTAKTVHEKSKSKFVEDDDDKPIVESKDNQAQAHVVDEEVVSTVQPIHIEDETTMNIENDIQNLPNVNRDKNNFQIYSTRSTFLNSTNRENFYTWNVCWNLHVYLTAILYTLLAVYSIYKIIRFDALTHLFNQGYFIIVHLLLTTICVSRIFYLIYDPYNINLSLPKFISDIFLNLPLSLLAIAFATLICYLLKRTLSKTHFHVRPLFVIIFSFVHIFLCITLHLLENFDLLGKNNHVLSLVCQFVYALLCLFLGFSYLYLYKIIKKVLSKKSQNFSELSVQNLSYATHITIAIALLFVLMFVLQIYGIFGIKTHERFSNLPPFKWLAWGFQFSIRLIEISIIALLSLVVSLKLSVREKNIENNLSGFALFPCANSNSTVDNEIYPAICQTNQNVHNFTLRSGKSLYDDNYPLNAIDGIPKEVIGRPNLGAPTNSDRNTFDRTANTFERSSKTSYPDHSHSNSNNFDRVNYERTPVTGRMTPSQGNYNEFFDRNGVERFGSGHYPGHAEPVQDMNCLDNDRHLDNGRGMVDDHYENPDFELETTCRRSKRLHEKYNGDNLDSCSVSSRTNSQHGGVRKLPPHYPGDHEQGLYNEPVDQTEYTFQKYEKPYFERPSSRTNSNYSSSKNMHRSSVDKRCNSSSSGGSSSTFERRSLRKSGTLNDFGERGSKHCSSHGYHRNGIQTLNSAQKHGPYGKNPPDHGLNDELSDSMLVDESGFVRFRNMGGPGGTIDNKHLERSRRSTNSKSREHKNKNIFT